MRRNIHVKEKYTDDSVFLILIFLFFLILNLFNQDK